MTMKRFECNKQCALWALLGLYLLSTQLFALGDPTQEVSQSPTSEVKLSEPDSMPARKPSIFDFSNYKRLFKRVYSGPLEQALRMKYFFARALRVFITATKFRTGELPYYFAINQFSDATPDELARMRNKANDREAGTEMNKPKERPIVVDIDSVNLGDNVEDGLRKLAKEHQDKSVFRELSKFMDESGGLKHQRKKRDVVSAEEIRDLPMDKLINTGSHVQLDPEVQAKLANRAPSNNPSYKGIELESRGLVDELKPIEFFSFDLPRQSKDIESGLIEALPSNPNRRRFWSRKLPDEVFVDLRNSSKCFTLPRDQGFCGACYAFAAIAIAEWMYCMQTGKLVPFSEQYMIDCGMEYIPGLVGCHKGKIQHAVVFLQNFGLELQANYPYLERQGQCPYSDRDPLNTTGYIRINKPVIYNMKLKEMAYLIENGPVYVAIKADRSFDEYGGGVHGVRCLSKTDADHGVVVIGHGRENGREYWLIRNSYGVGWGEGGYYKLDKRAGSICDEQGIAFATRTGLVSKMNAYTNPNNKPVTLHTPKTWANLNPDSLPTHSTLYEPEMISVLNWIEESVEGLFAASENYRNSL